MSKPRIRFLSLFVPSLTNSAKRYAEFLGVSPQPRPRFAPPRHPYSRKRPVVFDLGGVELALYEIDGRTTHAGDVGIGLLSADPTETVARGIRAGGARLASKRRAGTQAGDQREMVVVALPDRHFFEIRGRPTPRRRARRS